MVIRDSRHQRRVETRLAKIKHAVGDVSRASNRLRRVVGEARAEGATWTEVGEAIGITQQGAQKRYGTPGERADVVEARNTRRAARNAGKRASGPDRSG